MELEDLFLIAKTQLIPVFWLMETMSQVMDLLANILSKIWPFGMETTEKLISTNLNSLTMLLNKTMVTNPILPSLSTTLSLTLKDMV
jgi:hypothetical protein